MILVVVVRKKVDMLTKVEERKKRQKLRGESVCMIIEMDVEVADDDEFLRCVCSEGEKRTSRRGRQRIVWNE